MAPETYFLIFLCVFTIAESNAETQLPVIELPVTVNVNGTLDCKNDGTVARFSLSKLYTTIRRLLNFRTRFVLVNEPEYVTLGHRRFCFCFTSSTMTAFFSKTADVCNMVHGYVNVSHFHVHCSGQIISFFNA